MSETHSFWVSIDGVECAGKSSLASFLANSIAGSILLPEFSDSVVGRHLLRQVTGSPHHIDHSPLGQSLLFLADYADLAHLARRLVNESSRVIIQDRGYLSKFVYQYVVLRPSLGEHGAKDWLLAIMERIPAPDATILLDASIETIVRRFESDGRGRPSDIEVGFISEGLELFRASLDVLPSLGRTRRFRVAQGPDDQLLETAEAALREFSELARLVRQVE